MSKRVESMGVVTDLGPATGVVALPVHSATCVAVERGETDAGPSRAVADRYVALARDAARRAGHRNVNDICLVACPDGALGGDVAAAAAGARLGASFDATTARGLCNDNPDGDHFERCLHSACAALQAVPLAPQPHAVAASLTGRPHAVTHRYPPRTVALASSSWWLVVVIPRLDEPARGWSGRAPRSIDARKAIASSRALTGWLDAWARADGDALLMCSDDRIYDHAVLPHVPGAHPARHAALAAGALTVSLTCGGPGLAAVAPTCDMARGIADAMAAAWAAHRIETTFTVCPVSR